mgnify:CR=1 FL=1
MKRNISIATIFALGVVMTACKGEVETAAEPTENAPAACFYSYNEGASTFESEKEMQKCKELSHCY